MVAQIKTNNVPRQVLYGYELTEKEAAEFDYIEADDFYAHSFIRYKGQVYDLSEFVRIEKQGKRTNPFTVTVEDGDPLLKWDGILTDSYFSGIVVKYADECCESVIVGLYTC